MKKNVFNICSSKPQKLIDIITIINKFSKQSCNLLMKPKRKGEMIITSGDNSHLKQTINFKKFTTVEMGIKKTVSWFVKYKNKKSLNF